MREAIIAYLRSCTFAGKVFAEYYGEGNEAGYRHDKHAHDTDRAGAYNALARLGNITEAEMVKACKEAWSGRLEWNGKSFDYTPGQFTDLEMPQAMRAVLERVEHNRS